MFDIKTWKCHITFFKDLSNDAEHIFEFGARDFFLIFL